MDDFSFELFLKHIEYCRLFGRVAVDSAFDGNIEVAEFAGRQTAHWANLVLDRLHRPNQSAAHFEAELVARQAEEFSKLFRPAPPGFPDLEVP